MKSKWYNNGDLWFVMGLLFYATAMYSLWHIYWQIIYSH